MFSPSALRRTSSMLALTAVLAFAGAGCRSSYIITTTSGAKVVTASKPKLRESNYVYRDANGETVAISKLRVRAIEPYSKEAAGAVLKAPQLQ